MVILCKEFIETCNSNNNSNNNNNNTAWDDFIGDSSSSSFKKNIILSDFQKWAIKAITEDDNVLITAHTGSGKTLPAEFAIHYIVHVLKKKVIYTTPIKALSNQKLFEFRKKYPTISFGILTGDCKDNPEADVLIMTTEILRNTLFHRQINETKTNNTTIPLMFEMDFELELKAVIFDEVHYINDPERGSVWEQSILLLPPHVQLILLSATIDKPELFASWIETEKNKQLLYNNNNTDNNDTKLKKMYLTSTNERVVPLTHYMWLSLNSTIFNTAKKSPPYESTLLNLYKKPIIIADSAGTFNDINYHKVKDALHFIQTKCPNTRIHRQFVLNELVTYLNMNNMLPAICFVFSRKHVEKAAKEINTSLFEKDNNSHALISKECRHIISSKIVNYKEYLELPEYVELVALLEKGIAIHHAGMMPILREMVELLFDKGYIKLLFATETFAVGINMPTKTVVFSGLTKYNGNTMRHLFPHEYTQMAGRAGRRGIDTVGNVIHCNNLFEMPDISDYKNILAGKAQTLKSKFKISFNLILSIVFSKENKNKCDDDSMDADVNVGADMHSSDPLFDVKNNITHFIDKSLLAYDIQGEIKSYDVKHKELNETLATKKEQLCLTTKTPENVMKEYKEKKKQMAMAKNSSKKKLKNELNDIEVKYNFLEKDLKKYEAYEKIKEEINQNDFYRKNTADYISISIEQLVNHILIPNEFLKINDTTNTTIITTKGRFASQLQEIHPLGFIDIFTKTNGFEDLSAIELVGLFSCFTSINVPEDIKQIYPHTPNFSLNKISMDLFTQLEMYNKLEYELLIDSGANYDFHFDIQTELLKWCSCLDESECKDLIKKIKIDKNVSLGDFVKAILKINTIAKELEKICELNNDIILLEKLKQIPELTLKYVVTSQSLYL